MVMLPHSRTRSATTIVAILLAALVGCAGTSFRWEDTAKIHDGMTESEVVAILGKPYARSQSGSITVLTWSYASAFGSARAVAYQLKDGKVFGSTTVGK
jgi:outer membrane protein assembly factor BamE (lipoprotein component of BamABCDE complex)